jgi:hypothetical protein
MSNKELHYISPCFVCSLLLPTYCRRQTTPSMTKSILCLCTTGDHCGRPAAVTTAVRRSDLAPQLSLSYYIESLPCDKADSLLWGFRTACDAWTSCTGVSFTRASRSGACDFCVRSATQREEAERGCDGVAIQSFHWSGPEARAVILWQKSLHYDAHSLFLHAIGHILGLRHEHSLCAESVMSLDHLAQFVHERRYSAGGRAQLSLEEEMHAWQLYEPLRNRRSLPVLLARNDSQEEEEEEEQEASEERCVKGEKTLKRPLSPVAYERPPLKRIKLADP